MFARNVSMHLKPNSVTGFTSTIEHHVIPLLRKQKGFHDEIAFIVPNAMEAIAISFWDTKEDAEAYGRATYPEVLKALSKVVDGTPQVHIYEVSNSTFHKVVAPVTV